MRKSVRRQYEHKRKYDFGEAKERHHLGQVKFVKRRARRRFRHSQVVNING